MRGVQFSVLILFWIIGMGVIFAGTQFFPWFKQPSTTEVLVKTDVYMMDSAMDAARAYLDASIQYSNYQACYELLKKGGNSKLDETNKITVSNTDYGLIPDEDVFKKNVVELIQTYVNSYSGSDYRFFDKYVVSLPHDYKLTLSGDGSTVTNTPSVTMSSTTVMNGGTSIGDKTNFEGTVTIKRNVDFNNILSKNCMTYYNNMMHDQNDVSSSLRSTITNQISILEKGIIADTVGQCNAFLGINVAAGNDGISLAKKVIKDSEPTLSNDNREVHIGDIVIGEVPDLGSSGSIAAETSGPNKDKFVCKFNKSGPSMVNVDVVTKSKDTVPVLASDKISYQPLDGTFAFKVEY